MNDKDLKKLIKKEYTYPELDEYNCHMMIYNMRPLENMNIDKFYSLPYYVCYLRGNAGQFFFTLGYFFLYPCFHQVPHPVHL